MLRRFDTVLAPGKQAVLEAAAKFGKHIAGVQHVSENTHMFQSKRANAAVFAEESRAADVTPVEPGTLSLSADVHIDFLLVN